MRKHMSEWREFPAEYREDIERAIAILKAGGCREIYLFGSLAEG